MYVLHEIVGMLAAAFCFCGLCRPTQTADSLGRSPAFKQPQTVRSQSGFILRATIEKSFLQASFCDSWGSACLQNVVGTFSNHPCSGVRPSPIAIKTHLVTSAAVEGMNSSTSGIIQACVLLGCCRTAGFWLPFRWFV